MMNTQIKTRAAAIAAGENKYFTGKPCGKGHVAARYAQSGTCSACIVANNKSTSVSAQNSRQLRARARGELLEIKVRAFPTDITPVAAAAHMLAVSHNPLVTFEDVRPNKPPSKGAGGTVVYTLRVHPLDLETIEELGRRALAAHQVDIVAERARIFGIGERFAAESVSPPPEFRP